MKYLIIQTLLFLSVITHAQEIGIEVYGERTSSYLNRDNFTFMSYGAFYKGFITDEPFINFAYKGHISNTRIGLTFEALSKPVANIESKFINWQVGASIETIARFKTSDLRCKCISRANPDVLFKVFTGFDWKWVGFNVGYYQSVNRERGFSTQLYLKYQL